MKKPYEITGDLAPPTSREIEAAMRPARTKFYYEAILAAEKIRAERMAGQRAESVEQYGSRLGKSGPEVSRGIRLARAWEAARETDAVAAEAMLQGEGHYPLLLPILAAAGLTHLLVNWPMPLNTETLGSFLNREGPRGVDSLKKRKKTK